MEQNKGKFSSGTLGMLNTFKNFMGRNITPIFFVIMAICLTFTITYLSCIAMFNKQLSAVNNYGEGFAKIANVAQLYDTYYVGGELDRKQMIDNAMYGLVAGTEDKYGTYFSKEDLEKYMVSSTGKLIGIGVSVIYDPQSNKVKVVEVYNNSPAQTAGIVPGDYITGVNDNKLEDMGYYSLADEMLGEEGTDVSVDVMTKEVEKNIVMKRQVIDVDAVTYELLENNIGYIKISTFNEKTAKQFMDAMEQALMVDPLEGIVFDVRNNGGGDAMVIGQVLDSILPEGNVFKLIDKAGNEESYDSDSKTNLPLGLPVAVVVNGNTASAAELFAAALQDYSLGDVVGNTTFGKGTAISIIPFADGSGIAMSNSLYYTPSGRNLEGVGVVPDHEVLLNDEQIKNYFTMTKEEDPQLQKAIALIKSK